MAISVNWAAKRITIPQADLTFISGTLYELDTDWFRLKLRSLEDDEEGMPFPRTHKHSTAVTVAGTTYARVIEIVNGYEVEFTPDSQWSVRLVGSNNNIWDIASGVLVQNQVQVIPTNSAGLQTVETGTSGLTQTEAVQLEGVFAALLHGQELVAGDTDNFIIYEVDGVTPLYTFSVTDKDGSPIVVPTGTPSKRSSAV